MHRLAGSTARDLRLHLVPLSGGAEAQRVLRVTARYRNSQARLCSRAAVVKVLRGRPAREAEIYRTFVARSVPGLAPRFLSAPRLVDGRVLLFVEAVRRREAWPWRRPSALTVSARALGRFHATAASGAVVPSGWNYEDELHGSARATVEALGRCRNDPDLADLVRQSRPAARLVDALPRLRGQILGENAGPLGRRIIHGDVHSGNAMIVQRGGLDRLLLLDWGRARLGSPLEDVSSWLQTLRPWEPRAMAMHDTLLTGYLEEAGISSGLTSNLRSAYWIAGASNALAGALRWHLDDARSRPIGSPARNAAVAGARNWVRVLRRAHAWTM